MRQAAAVLILMAATGSTGGAQQVWISAIHARSTNALVHTPVGPSAGVTWRLDDRLSVRAAYHLLEHRRTRVGTTCVGLILDPVTECPPEPVDDRGAFNGFAVSVVATVARRGNVSAALVPSVGLVEIRSRSHGRQTGRTLTAATSMIGFGAGAELSVVPHTRWPVALHAGAHLGTFDGGDEGVVDGYSPFSGEALQLRRLELGISIWKPHPAARVTTR